MTAIAAKIGNCKGAYRCPGEKTVMYVAYTDLRFANASDLPGAKQQGRRDELECDRHGLGKITYVCEHLLTDPKQEWFSEDPRAEKPWPDAWCAQCDSLYQRHGEWNDDNSAQVNIKVICHHCYESLRAVSQ
jgi:hypothetical protein